MSSVWGQKFWSLKYALLTGESAGGFGTWANIDWFAQTLRRQFPNVIVKGAPIAGWFFPGEPHSEGWFLFYFILLHIFLFIQLIGSSFAILYLAVGKGGLCPDIIDDYQNFITNTSNNAFCNDFLVTLYSATLILNPNCTAYYPSERPGSNLFHSNCCGSFFCFCFCFCFCFVLIPSCFCFPTDETFLCSLAHSAYPFIATDLFFAQHQFDSNQIFEELECPHTNPMSANEAQFIAYFGRGSNESVSQVKISESKLSLLIIFCFLFFLVVFLLLLFVYKPIYGCICVHNVFLLQIISNSQKNDGIFMPSCLLHTERLLNGVNVQGYTFIQVDFYFIFPLHDFPSAQTCSLHW
jgi:hypothetical protein